MFANLIKSLTILLGCTVFTIVLWWAYQKIGDRWWSLIGITALLIVLLVRVKPKFGKSD